MLLNTAVAALLALLLGLLPACAAPGESPVRVRPLRGLDLPLPLDRLTLEAAFELQGGSPRVSGLSALLVEGTALIALSDRGALWRARIVEAPSGRLRDVVDWQRTRLRRVDGRTRIDSEGLARLPDGALAVTLEDPVTLMRLDPGGALHPLPFPAALRAAPPNQGVEAVADLPDGGLLLITEGQPGERPGSVLAGIQRGEESRLLSWRPAPGFRATGADRLGPLLFVVERRASLLGGFEARIVLLDLDEADLAAGAVLAGEELARLGADTVAENFEGIAARRAGDGSVLLYLVSDDNGSVLQRTLLLQFRYRP